MATKMPVWFETEFPNWKKNLWGAVRAFIDGFLGTLATCLITANTDNILTREFWVNVVLISSFTGAIVYLGKWLRDKFYASPAAQKMPI